MLYMTYLLRTSIEKKYLLTGLTSVYGLGLASSKVLFKRLGFTPSFLVKSLTVDQEIRIAEVVKELKLPLLGNLQRQKKESAEALFSIKSYRGIRLYQGLPVRGQRTHTNAKTAKKFRRLKKTA